MGGTCEAWSAIRNAATAASNASATRHRSRPGLSDTRHPRVEKHAPARRRCHSRRSPDRQRRVQLDDRPGRGIVERPHGPAGVAEPAQHGHPPQRSRSDRARPGELEDRLRMQSGGPAHGMLRRPEQLGVRRPPRAPRPEEGWRAVTQPVVGTTGGERPPVAAGIAVVRGGRTIRGSRTRSRGRPLPRCRPRRTRAAGRRSPPACARARGRSRWRPRLWRSRCGGAAPVRRGRRTSRPRRSAPRGGGPGDRSAARSAARSEVMFTPAGRPARPRRDRGPGGPRRPWTPGRPWAPPRVPDRARGRRGSPVRPAGGGRRRGHGGARRRR